MRSIGLIGLGSISPYILEAIKKSPDFELFAVCDTDPEKLKPFNVRSYTTVDSLLKSDVEGVVVALPNYLHYIVAKKALLAEKHVMCEKPIATQEDHARDLIDISFRVDRTLFTIFHRRYNKNISDLLGNSFGKEVVSFSAKYNEYIDEHATGESWYQNIEQSGGGCVIDNGTNVFDVLSHIVGPMNVVNSDVYYSSDTVDTKANITLSFEKGRGTVELDWFYPYGEQKDITFVLNDGTVLQRDFLKGYPSIRDSNGSYVRKTSLFHEYELGLSDFALSIDTKRDHGEKGLDALRLVCNCYRRK